MLVTTVARIDHVDVFAELIEVLCDQEGRTALRMPHNEQIRVHRSQVIDRIQQALALRGRTGGNIQVKDIRRKPLRRDLKSRSCSR